jgi:uncharacterized Zn finger protein
MFCPLCGKEIPEEDQDVMKPPDQKLVSQVQCRPCGKVFTICEEKQFIRVLAKRPNHPEDR